MAISRWKPIYPTQGPDFLLTPWLGRKEERRARDDGRKKVPHGGGSERGKGSLPLSRCPTTCGSGF